MRSKPTIVKCIRKASTFCNQLYFRVNAPGNEAFQRKEGIGHTLGRPYHPITQGKIERYHRSMKNILLLENYYSPDELIDQIDLFIEYYNNHRYHEALNNLTPADVYYGRNREILTGRQEIKKITMLERRKYNCSLKVA